MKYPPPHMPTLDEIARLAAEMKAEALAKKLDSPPPKSRGDWSPQVYRAEAPPEEENSP